MMSKNKKLDQEKSQPKCSRIHVLAWLTLSKNVSLATRLEMIVIIKIVNGGQNFLWFSDFKN